MLTDARDRIKQFAFILQIRVVVDVVLDFLEQRLDLPVEPVNTDTRVAKGGATIGFLSARFAELDSYSFKNEY